MRTQAICRRLNGSDADRFQAMRLESFTLEPGAFRFAPEDEAHIAADAVAAAHQRDFVVGVFSQEDYGE